MGTNWGEHSTTQGWNWGLLQEEAGQYEQNSVRDVWSEMKKITGFKVTDNNRHQQGNLKGAEKLNDF